MRFSGIIGILCLVVAVFAASTELTGKAWQERKAADKADTVWKRVNMFSGQPGDWPSTFQLLELFVENISLTFSTVSDEFPKQGLLNRRRKKLVHSVGSIARVKFVSTGDHPYTGLFKGADHGFMRWSLAADFTPKSFACGVAVKFMRDGMRSANFMSMISLTGQSDGQNLFKHDFSNHIPSTSQDSPKAIKLVAHTFRKGSKWANFVGISDVASYDQAGTKEATVVSPFRVVLHPNKDVRASFPESYPNAKWPLVAQETIPDSGMIYEVFAYAEPTADPVKIGEFVLETASTASRYADETLFFQHQKFDEDLTLRPDWVPYVTELNEADEARAHQRVPKDLPFE